MRSTKKYSRISVGAGFAAAFAIVLLVSSCGEKEQDGRLRITTSSRAARDLFIQGRDLYEKLRITESLELLTKALEHDPDFALAHVYYGLAAPTFKELHDHFGTAKSLMENISEGEQLFIQAVEAEYNGNVIDQGRHLRSLVTTCPRDEQVHYRLGFYYFDQQKYPEAIGKFSKAAEINPDFAAPYNLLGYAYRAIENYEKAEVTFLKYIDLLPDDPNPYDSYGELLMKMGRHEESIANYRKAIAKNPLFLYPYDGIACNLMYQDQHEAARRELQTMYDAAQDEGIRRHALLAIAVTYMDEGNLENALTTLDQCYGIAEEAHDSALMAGGLVEIGYLHLEADRFQDASSQFEESLGLIRDSDLDDDFKLNAERMYLFRSAKVLLGQGRIHEAETLADSFSTMVRATADAILISLTYELSGLISLAREDYEGAIPSLRRSNQENPRNLYRLAVAYQQADQTKHAREYARKAAYFNELSRTEFALVRKRAMALLEELGEG